nr:hypothetical protein CFP56_62958 [Quercus suber]
MAKQTRVTTLPHKRSGGQSQCFRHSRRKSNLIRLVMITKKSLEQSGSKGHCRSEEAHKMAERDIATNLKFACLELVGGTDKVLNITKHVQ